MVVVTVSCGGAPGVPFIVPNDVNTLVSALQPANVGAVISQNPNLVFTDLSTPSGGLVRFDVITVIPQTGNTEQLNIPVVSGETWYVAARTAGSYVFMFDQL